MADHALATVDNPSSALTDFTLIVDLSNMPANWWSDVNTSDGTRGRVYKGDGTTRLAADWIDFDDTAETGLLRVKWSGTLASTGTQQLWIEPPVSGNATVAASDTYGSDNAYDSSWEAYWSTDESSGNLTDRTSNGIVATAQNTPGYRQAAPIGYGIHLDQGSTSDYFSIPASNSLNITDPITIISWVYPDSHPGFYNRIFGGDETSSPYAGYAFATRAEGYLRVYTDGGGWQQDATDIGTLAWAHVAWTNNGTTTNYYVDGANTGSDSQGGPSTHTSARSIGHPAGSDESFDGDIAHISVHSAVRSTAWISQEYDQTSDNATFWGTWTWTSSGGGTTVSVSALDHTHALDTVSITQTQNIGVADSFHAHALDTVAIQQINNIEIASMFHAGELDTVTLTQTHSIGIGDLFHAHVLDDTGITQRHNISVDELSHAHELDTVAVTIGEQINAIADDLYSAHVLDGVSLTQRQNVTVEDLYHDHVVDGASLSPRVTVSISDLSHTHELDGVGYTQAHVIVVDDITHEQSQGTVALTQRHFLTIQDLVQAHGLDAVNFTIAEGIVTLTFTGKSGSATFTNKTGRIVWTQ